MLSEWIFVYDLSSKILFETVPRTVGEAIFINGKEKNISCWVIEI